MNHELHSDSGAKLLFDLDADSIRSQLANKGNQSDSQLICVCGHPANSHQVLTQNHSGCFTARMYCPCRTPVPVTRVSNSRFFKAKTRGWGERHALSIGLLKLHDSGGTAEALDGTGCFGCESQGPALIPTSMDEFGMVLEYPGQVNALLCRSCWLDRDHRGTYSR